jgi:hypothetical protein
MKLTPIPNRTETLGQAVAAAELYAAEKGFQFKDKESWNRDIAFCGGVAYGTHRTFHGELETGKPRAKKYLHLTVTRMDNGTYEPVAYIN